MSDSDGQPSAANNGQPATDRSSRAAASPEEIHTDEISFAEVLAVFLRHRRVLVAVPIAVALAWLVISLILPQKYTSEAVFTPSSSAGQLSQLAGLAAQFGVSVPQGQTGESPGFYADLVQSRQLLRTVVRSAYRFPTSSDPSADTLSGNLVTLLNVGDSLSPELVEKAVDKLQGRLSVVTDATTGLVTVDVQTRWAALSQAVVQKLVELVNDFNLETLQTQASAERRFLEGRVSTVRDSLRAAEDGLQAFLEHNRSYQSSPELQFEYDRLQRRVSLQQQVYTTLAQSLEQAKIDQVRNTPVITVVEPPILPARPDKRHLILKMILGLVLGGVVAVVWAFVAEWSRRARQEEPEDYRELGELWRETLHDVRGLWQRVRRRSPH